MKTSIVIIHFLGCFRGFQVLCLLSNADMMIGDACTIKSICGMYFYGGKVLPSQLADIVQSLTDKSDVFLFGRSVIDRGPVRIRSFTHARDSAWRQTVAQI